VLPDRPAVAAADIRGGAPGTREMDALDPATLVEAVHGVVLSGGSVFGLDAASGVVEWLAARGVGFTFGAQPLPCPVVPSAILFDLANGGDNRGASRHTGRSGGRPARRRRRALRSAMPEPGSGPRRAVFKGGLGSASVVWEGVSVGALVAVNSFGSPADPLTGELWAGPTPWGRIPARARRRRQASARPAPGPRQSASRAPPAGANTTIAIVATDAMLTRPEAKRLAIMAADGMARALRPVHTPFDGDSVIALATGRIALAPPPAGAVGARHPGRRHPCPGHRARHMAGRGGPRLAGLARPRRPAAHEVCGSCTAWVYVLGQPRGRLCACAPAPSSTGSSAG
jgi:L-aminopeptidase/D-esterase-like protein